MKRTRPASMLLLALVSFVWGSSFVAQSAGLAYIGPFTINSVRYLLGALVLVPLAAVRAARAKRRAVPGQTPAVSRHALILRGAGCGVFLAAASSFAQVGLQYTSVGKVSFLSTLYVVLLPLARLARGKRPPWALWPCVGAALLGLFLLCAPGASGFNRGDALALLGALVWTGHILWIDRYAPGLDAVAFSLVQFLTAGLICAVPMLIWERPTLSALAAARLPIAYAGVMSCGVGFTCQAVGQQHADPTVAALILSLESVFGALSGWVILGETLSALEILGCALMFGATVATQLVTRGGNAPEIAEKR